MRILNCAIENFASYKYLEFEFDNQGLTLISGPTGSGKSTLCDVVPWILFGRTAKGGTVDEIRSWGADEPTTGNIILEANGQQLEIMRTRKPNDLWYYKNEESTQIRGKDLNDTQKQINNLLGFDYELYMSAAYFHEFSTTGSFFTTTAKVRRQITEQLVDLSLAKKLVTNGKDYLKKLKVEQDKAQAEHSTASTLLKSVVDSIKQDKEMAKEWSVKAGKKLVELQAKVVDYDKDQAKRLVKATKEHKSRQQTIEEEIQELKKTITPDTELEFYRAALVEEQKAFGALKGTKCLVCGAVKGHKDQEIILLKKEHDLVQREASNAANKRALDYKIKELARHTAAAPTAKEQENPYIKPLEDLTLEENPYLKSVKSREEKLDSLKKDVAIWKDEITELKTEISDIELLLDVTDTFRSVLIKNTVVDLETQTNKILHDYFDAEIQVKFELSDSDKLEVTIQKDGNEASFTQLSKGQRQLLKMSFGVSVMTYVSNHHGIDFNCIFLDEFTDGLDENMKVKSFALLEKLSTQHESVFCVEHNETMKSMFPKRYEIELTDGESQIGEA